MSKNHPNISTRISSFIGHSPLIELINTSEYGHIFLKMEQFNPTGTAKIRMARQILDEAEHQGKLPPGGWIIESTSGNTGLALAMLAAERGYRFTAVVDSHSSKDKLRAMQAYGAELIMVGDSDGNLATADRDLLAEKISIENGAYCPKQHVNPGNPNGYVGLAEELLDLLGTNIDYIYGAVGTGGSLCGTGRVLRECAVNVKIVGVEPEGSVIFGGIPGFYFQSGTGVPEGSELGKIIDFELIDEGLQVRDCEAFETARFLAHSKGILLGGSAGGVIYKALQKAQCVTQDTVIVALVCDGGEKYLDTIFNDEWMLDNNLFSPEVSHNLERMIHGIQYTSI